MDYPNKILVFAAHQDDETIGCGGTIRKWSSNGSIVDVVFMTDGGTGVDQSGRFDSDIVSTRRKEAEQAAERKVYDDAVLGTLKSIQETLGKNFQTVSSGDRKSGGLIAGLLGGIGSAVGAVFKAVAKIGVGFAIGM